MAGSSLELRLALRAKQIPTDPKIVYFVLVYLSFVLGVWVTIFHWGSDNPFHFQTNALGFRVWNWGRGGWFKHHSCIYVFGYGSICRTHAGAVFGHSPNSVSTRPGLDQGMPFAPRHFSCNFWNKMVLVTYPCAFRLRRLAQNVSLTSGVRFLS